MSFEPAHPYYVNFNTASFIEASSSIGPTGIEILTSNQEWLYHNINSQVLINSSNTTRVTASFMLGTENNITKLVKSYAPVRLNLNKVGKPQSMFLAFKGHVLKVGASTGYFTFVLSGESDYQQNLVSMNLTSSNLGALSTNWQTLIGSFTDYENYSYGTTGSVNTIPISPLYGNPVRTDKSLTSPNNSQPTAYAYLSVYYTQTSSSVGSIGNPVISGLFLREVNPYIP